MSADNRVPLVTRVPPDLRTRVQAYADAHTITLSRAAEILITQALTRQEQA